MLQEERVYWKRERLEEDDIWGNICNFTQYESQNLNNDANGQEKKFGEYKCTLTSEKGIP